MGTFYGSFDKAFISKLCKQLSEVANEGDSLARHIFEEAGTDLAKSISSVICKASPELTEKEDGIQINCVGSVWLSWRLLKKGFIEYLNTNSDVQKLSLIKLTTSSSVGAALMASDKLDIPVARDYSKNYEVFFKYTKGMSLNCS